MLDVGKITWNENATNITSRGSYEFKGIDLIDVIEDDSLAFENTLDTLSDIFNFQEKFETRMGINDSLFNNISSF